MLKHLFAITVSLRNKSKTSKVTYLNVRNMCTIPPTMDQNSKTPVETLKTPSSPSPSQFAFTITRTAVSQICQYIGFEGSKVSALETLTHIATIYLQTLAEIAASHAANSNRTDSNLFDVIVALEDLASVQGFRCASGVRNSKSLWSSVTSTTTDSKLIDVIVALEWLASTKSGGGVRDHKKPLLSSTALIDIVNFVDDNDEVPFAKPVPRFNSSRRRRPPKNLNLILRKKKKNVLSPQRDYQQISSHIPRWLPPFPDPSTYEIDNAIRFSKSIGSGNSSNRSDALWNCGGTGHDLDDSSAKRIEERKKEEEEEERKERELRGLLPGKRGRVRFKMGLVEREGLLKKVGVKKKLRNGVSVCRSGKMICLEQ